MFGFFKNFVYVCCMFVVFVGFFGGFVLVFHCGFGGCFVLFALFVSICDNALKYV